MANPDQEKREQRKGEERIRLESDSIPEGLSLEYSLRVQEEPSVSESETTVVDMVMKGITERGQ